MLWDQFFEFRLFLLIMAGGWALSLCDFSGSVVNHREEKCTGPMFWYDKTLCWRATID